MEDKESIAPESTTISAGAIGKAGVVLKRGYKIKIIITMTA